MRASSFLLREGWERGPGKPGGEARAGLAVPAAVEISKDLARLGAAWGGRGAVGSAAQSGRRGEAVAAVISLKVMRYARCLGGAEPPPRTHAEGDGDAVR